MAPSFFSPASRFVPAGPPLFGRAQKRYYFGLPGNPVSTMVTFELDARPLMESLAGMHIRFLHARLKSEVRAKTGLKRFFRVCRPANSNTPKWNGRFGTVPVTLPPTARSNCYIVVPPDREKNGRPGEWVAATLRPNQSCKVSIASKPPPFELCNFGNFESDNLQS